MIFYNIKSQKIRQIILQDFYLNPITPIYFNNLLNRLIIMQFNLTMKNIVKNINYEFQSLNSFIIIWVRLNMN